MTALEGVIKFKSKHRHEPVPTWAHSLLRELEAWRSILRALELIGQDGVRYAGAGWGNVSARLPPWHDDERRPFLITGTQTGGLPRLTVDQFVIVERCSLVDTRVESYGPVLPSSEAMTHAAMYATNPRLRFVFHAHCREIWSNARRLELPCTPEGVDYGTREMAWAVEKLLGLKRTYEQGAIVMLGHEDGVITFGETAEAAGEAMMRWLARARALHDRCQPLKSR